MASAEVAAPSASRSQTILSAFEGYRSRFDDFNERRERLIVISRQITSLSKKLIFHLHRVSVLRTAHAGDPSTYDEARRSLLDEADGKIREIVGWLSKVRDELKEAEEKEEGSSGMAGKGQYWAFARNISPGLQEYIEGLSFLHYLRSQSLITAEEVQQTLVDPETGGELFRLPAEEYALGISDLTGELMRYATNCSSSGDHATAIHVCAFVRGMKAELDSAQPFVRDLAKKQAVTAQSLAKIENICYAIQLRMVEYADRPDVLERLTKRALEESEMAEDGQGEEGAQGGEQRQGGGHRGRGGGGGARGRGRGRGHPGQAGLTLTDEDRSVKRGRVGEGGH